MSDSFLSPEAMAAMQDLLRGSGFYPVGSIELRPAAVDHTNCWTLAQHLT